MGRMLVLILLSAWFLVACVIALRPHEWNAGHGEVIPHESFPADCSLCHSSEGWRPLRSDFTFDHEAETSVALVGAHKDAQCLRCHNDRGPVAHFARQGCTGCHVDPHELRLGQQCVDCHDQSSWIPRGQIAAHSRTLFPLVGAHIAVDCSRCHAGAEVGQFSNEDVRCEACHSPDLARANDPDHRQLGWVDRCEQCHQPTSWNDERFRHSVNFRLTGSHSAITCDSCHVGGNFGTMLSSECVSCHLPEYQTADPSHTSPALPTQCETCHNTVSWSPAQFSHGFFPLSGDHGGLDCNDCHQTPGNFSAITCTTCHAHIQSEADDEHDDVDGYVWSSAACLSCHPSGRE